MDDNPPPRKQSRVLAKGREKVGQLLGRRKKKKMDDRSSDSLAVNDVSDVEDEVPILWRIADPSTASRRSAKDKLEHSSTSESKLTSKSTVEKQGSNEEVTNGTSPIHKDAVREQKRKGVVGIDELKGRSQTAFTTKIVMAQHRPIATQSSPAKQTLKFTFKSNVLSTSHSSGTPSFGPQPRKIPPTEPQLQQAARNAFLESKPEPSHVADEEFKPQKKGIEVQSQSTSKKSGLSSVKLPDRSAKSTGTSQKVDAVQPSASQPVRAKRMFDSFKLGSGNIGSMVELDKAASINSVSQYIQQKISLPEPGPELYRSLYHKPTIAKVYMQQSLPDGIESAQFIEDVEVGSTPMKKNEMGDFPALVHDPHMERVPIGARDGRFTARIPVDLHPGRHAMQAPFETVDDHKVSRTYFSVPENLYTEPNRLSSAYLSSQQNLKRKRPVDTTLPPPSYVYKHTSSPTFNIFTNGILLYPELCLLLASHLPVQALINLYSISKDYHVILNQRFTTVILNQATKKAPAATRCYPWRCFANLCQLDPAYTSANTPLSADFTSRNDGTNVKMRSPPPAIHEATGLPGCHAVHTIKHRNIKLPASKRKVPTFRWLHIAIHREKTIHELYWHFAARGVPLPGAPTILHRGSFALSLHKLWFAFDIPDNTRRMSYFASPHLITPPDLSNILVFITKLDMICNDPLAGDKRDNIRKIFMTSANGFNTLRAALSGEIWRDELEMLRSWTRYGFQLDREDGQERGIGGGWVPLGLSTVEHAMSETVFGIPREEVGLHKKEFWGKMEYDPVKKTRKPDPIIGRKPMYLMRPDQIVIREAIRRGMRMGKQFLRGLMFGYVDEETLTAVSARDLNGGRSLVLEEEGEYGVDDLVGGVRALAVEDGGDPLLDLGDPWEGSALTVRKVGRRKQVLQLQEVEGERLEGYRRAWREEVERETARKAYTGFTYVDG